MKVGAILTAKQKRLLHLCQEIKARIIDAAPCSLGNIANLAFEASELCQQLGLPRPPVLFIRGKRGQSVVFNDPLHHKKFPESRAYIKSRLEHFRPIKGSDKQQLFYPDLTSLKERAVPLLNCWLRYLDTDIEPGNELYPWPNELSRDKWIYDHIGTMRHNDLSVELEFVSKENGWRVIKSRNAIKDAARRYAEHHGLKRKGDSTVTDCQ